MDVFYDTMEDGHRTIWITSVQDDTYHLNIVSSANSRVLRAISDVLITLDNHRHLQSLAPFRTFDVRQLQLSRYLSSRCASCTRDEETGVLCFDV